MKKILEKNLVYLIIILFYEFMLELLLFDSFNRETIFSIIIYSIFSSLIITFITSIFPRVINKIINYIIYFILSFYFSLEFVFKSSIKTFFTMAMFKISDQAVGFASEMFYIIYKNLYGIVILFIPFILFIIFNKKFSFDYEKHDKLYLLSYLVFIPLVYFGYTGYLKYMDNSNISMYDLYYNIDNIPLSIQRLGLLPSMQLDVRRSIFGFEDKIIEVEYTSGDIDNSEDLFVYEDNRLDISFEEGVDPIVKKYIEDSTPTKKNKYSGIFEGKNLIFVVAESFSTIGIDKELTPTLYKLTHSSFIFNNFYVPYYLSTIGGEFSAVNSLLPNYSTLSIWRRGENSYPFSMPNSFRSKGYNTYAYHDHSGYFQDRYKYLKAIGFNNFKACDMNLNINCDVWPESDIEMINSTYSDYIKNEPFMTYYMTVSGHLEYDFNGNYIANKNKKYVGNLPYSDKAKAYLATQIELDRALELLINKLDSNNILDDTVIVLTADHYPYGLSIDEINELSSYEREEEFSINHNSLIIWNNKMKNIVIDKVCMPIDIIPTIYNLFGIDYDSRLFVGEDILSSGDGLVILGDRSWITSRGKYNSTNNTYKGDINEEYVDNINNIINNKTLYSKTILENDGYKYIKILEK